MAKLPKRRDGEQSAAVLPKEPIDAATPETGEATSMEIHIPKPWHGPRELAKEVGVIVIGIAIALTGEQTLEWLHRQSEVREAREALHSEIAATAANARVTIEQERCAARQLDGYAAWAGGDSQRPIATTRPFIMPRSSNWEIVKVSAAAQMPLEERLAYARFYDTAQSLRTNSELGITIWLRLWGAALRPKLDETQAQAILEDVATARNAGRARSQTSQELIDKAEALGVPPAPVPAATRQRLASLCADVGLKSQLD
jgi:hypothetical protein